MQPIIAQIALPIILALIMLGMGLALKISDFKAVIAQPKAIILGLILQILLLPTLAIAIITLLPLTPAASVGLFLVSLCAGGATSNLFSFIAKGNIALSVSLTGIVSMLSPVLLPLLFVLFLNYSGLVSSSAFKLPLDIAFKKLFMVTLLPISMGMLIRHFASDWAQASLPAIKKLSTFAMLGIIFALLATNVSILPAMFSLDSVAVLLLSSTSLSIAYAIARALNIHRDDRKTVALEVGVQNAGTAIMVALSIMGEPLLAVVPLLYGILMNIPAFGFVLWVRAKENTSARNNKIDMLS
jgi:BASS family bile acid:Na+ symporter